jgi:hypothetical protein
VGFGRRLRAKFKKNREELVNSPANHLAEVSGQALPVLFARDLPGWEGGQSLADLVYRQAYTLSGPDHGNATKHIGEESSLVAGRALARQQTVIVVPADRGRRNPHPRRDLADTQPAHMPLVVLDNSIYIRIGP